MAGLPIPSARSTPLAPDGAWRTEWFLFLSRLADQSDTATAEELRALAARVDAIENESALSAQLIGTASVTISGLLAGGIVNFALVNDEAIPAASHYYGTSHDGERGWLATPEGAIGATFDGGGEVLEVGAFCDVRATYDGTISDFAIYVEPSGSVVIDIRKCAHADYPPDAPDSIVGGAPPTVSADVSSIDTTLTGWTIDFAKGDIFRFQITSATDIEKASISLKTIK